MAKHKANHIQVAYVADAKATDPYQMAKAAMAGGLGTKVNLCAARKDGKAWVNWPRRLPPALEKILQRRFFLTRACTAIHVGCPHEQGDVESANRAPSA